MSYFNNQQQAPVSYPPTVNAYPTPAGEAYPSAAYVSAPPPMGYPTKDGPAGAGYPQQTVPDQTTTSTRGDGFWKGCCAAICCCCVLDACF